MWDMSKTKICRGYKKPAHEVPISGFSKHPNSPDGLQHYCRECANEAARIFQINRKRHPITGVIKNNWKRGMAKKLGGKPDTPEWQSYLDKTETIWDEETKDIEAEAWLNIVFPAPPKDNLPVAKPSRKRTSATYTKPLPKEGWVYVMHTGLYNKIGKTWENGLRARRTEARRWGPADLVYWAWFDDAMAAEKEIHRRLKRYKVEKENVGEELFNCSVDTAKDEIKKLQEELEDYDREEQEVG